MPVAGLDVHQHGLRVGDVYPREVRWQRLLRVKRRQRGGKLGMPFPQELELLRQERDIRKMNPPRSQIQKHSRGKVAASFEIPPQQSAG
jgi:hypothetical protein